MPNAYLELAFPWSGPPYVAVMTSSSSDTDSPSERRSVGRTRLITAASIVAVVLAGAAAVSANVGILDSASDSSVGNASAAGDLADPSSRVLDVYLPDEVDDGDDDPREQTYEVDVAGKVTVRSTDDGLSLDEVDPEDGWRWTSEQPDATHLVVVLTNGTRTFELHAARNDDGTITARVTEPIDDPTGSSPGPAQTSAPSVTPSTSAPTPRSDDDLYDDDPFDDHGGDRDEAADALEDAADDARDAAEDRAKDQEDRSGGDDRGRDDDD